MIMVEEIEIMDLEKVNRQEEKKEISVQIEETIPLKKDLILEITIIEIKILTGDQEEIKNSSQETMIIISQEGNRNKGKESLELNSLK